MEVKWLPLRLNIIPLIDRQTRQVLVVFQQVRDDILQGDILAVQRLQELKETIRQRLRALDDFYRAKAMDPRTRYLFAARTLLSKMLDSHHNFEQFAQQDSHPPTPNNNPQPTSRSRKSISPISSTRRTPTRAAFAKQSQPTSFKNTNNSFFEKRAQKTEGGEEMRLSDIQKSTKRKSPVKVKEEYVGKKGSSRKIEQGQTGKAAAGKKSEEVHELERERAEQSARLERDGYDIKKSFKDLSELVFTIKMTKEEYNSFMMLKRKNNHA